MLQFLKRIEISFLEEKLKSSREKTITIFKISSTSWAPPTEPHFANFLN